jgi:pimeloyl-ACP methyl ester carboxylesterase
VRARRAGRLTAVAALAALLVFVPGPAAAADEPRVLRYDLRPGDHLVYRETLERTVRSAREEQQARMAWDAHVLVVAAGDGHWRVGIQRNRTGAELLRHRRHGRDALEEGRRTFAEQLAARGPSFAEANWVTSSGRALLAWSAVREGSSERLPLFHEIEPLPDAPVAVGAAFEAPGLLAIPMRAAATEAVGAEQCVRLEGEASGGALRVRQWHCPSSGTLGRLEYEARYGGPGGAEVEERYRLDRTTIGRGEAIEAWLRGAATAQGALAVLAVSPRLPVAASLVYTALDGASESVERLALAVGWRHRLAAPPLPTLTRLAASPSPRVRTLVARLLGASTDPAAAAERGRLAGDPDAFVRAAAAPPAPPPEALVALARAVRGGEPLPSWTGPLDAGLGRQALLAQRAAGQAPGATLRFLRSRPGWPYVLHVPEDYRGDEPFPLVFVLGGGPGRALPTAQTARATVDPRGALVVYPQANGLWWEAEAAAAFDALFAEVLSELNVDTDRVTITGFSNGGTGALLYAARHPDRFAAVASLMGGGLPFFQETEPIEAEAIARVPFLFVHGDRDEIIPAWSSERTAKAMRKANPEATAELRLLPGRGHDVVYGRDDGLSLPFLESRTRDPRPRRVSLRAHGQDGLARAFWVAIAEKSGGTAAVDGAIDGQSIVLRARHVRRLRLLLRPGLLDLSQPVRVTINGKPAYEGAVAPDPALFTRTWRETGDPQLAAAAELVLDVR